MLTHEDGTGLATAESMLSVAALDALALQLNWTDWPASGQQVAAKEAAARKGTLYIEARFRGRIAACSVPLSTTQRLLFPVSGTFEYPDGRTLPDGEWLPWEAEVGYGEAIRRAYTGKLSPDLPRGGQVIEKTVGPITTIWAESAPTRTSFDDIELAMRPLWWAAGPIQAVA